MCYPLFMARYIPDPLNPSMPREVAKVHLQREYLNNMGYTSRGRYFGTGAPLYRYWTDDGEIDGWVRAVNRAQARELIRREIPGAIFYR